jgi:hypothetical protein
MASASDIERLRVRTGTPGLLSPGSALTRVSPTKNKRRCDGGGTRGKRRHQHGFVTFLTECIFWTTVSRGIHFQKKPVFTVGLLGE